nr:alanine racemase [Microbulbifer sp. NKW57]
MVAIADASEGLLTIDLGAICENYRRLNARLGPEVRCSAVVKADAYGLGVAKVAPALYREGCRDFFVATQAEGVRLGALLPDDARIIILSGVRPGREKECALAGLVPTLVNTAQVQSWASCCRALGIPAPSVLKMDSGMGRLGLSAREVRGLLAQPELLKALNPCMFISHLACADEPAHPLNQQQLSLFSALAAEVRAVLPDIVLSLANSSGIFLGEAYHFDLVRPGAALYGINPEPENPNPLCAVVQLSLPVIQIRHVEKDCTVGYGAAGKMPAGGVMAVARGGYADGLLRAQSNRGSGEVAGVRVPMVGTISMDSTMFDISALPEPQRSEIKEIEVINRNLTVDEVARHAGTIGYEVLTSLGSRYFRRYLKT